PPAEGCSAGGETAGVTVTRSHRREVLERGTEGVAAVTTAEETEQHECAADCARLGQAPRRTRFHETSSDVPREHAGALRQHPQRPRAKSRRLTETRPVWGRTDRAPCRRRARRCWRPSSTLRHRVS